MLQIIKIHANGTFETDRIDGSLASMQAIVGGYIQAVDFGAAGADATLWLNEEGKLAGLDTNAMATGLVGHRLFAGDRIVGDVFITGGTDDEGESLGLSNAQVDAIINKLAEIGPGVLG